MLSRLRTDTTFKVKETKQFTFSNSEAGSATEASDMAVFGGPQQDEIWKPEVMDISYGLGQDPTDIGVDWGLQWRAIDDVNPSGFVLSNNDGDSIWSAKNRWRLVGAGTGVIETMDKEHHVFDEADAKKGSIHVPRLVLVLLAFSATTAAVSAAGNMDIQVEMEQINYADDFDEYEFDFTWEESY